MSQEIIQVPVTNSSSIANRAVSDTATIIVDAGKVKMLSGQTLLRQAPNGSFFIVIDRKGRALQRHDKATGSDSYGVSLTSYLFGKVGMRRNDIQDVDDYSRYAYKKGCGRPAAIRVIDTETLKVVETLFLEEYTEWKNSKNPECDEITKLNREIKNRKDKIASVLREPAGTDVYCPCCEKVFTKFRSDVVYCSSYSKDGVASCKELYNSQITEMRKKIESLGGVVETPLRPTKKYTPRKIDVKPSTSSVTVVPTPSAAFKTIGGIPFTLEETKVLLSDQDDQAEFKEYRGIMFSLNEIRQMVLK